MYLKKLTIQGFKSFVNRTTFEFSGGVTAVVGPNGSGKSNVADSIRWVLGEQSSRLLRARRQEDVIFAGTRDRGAVGMAEVLLTLDNSERWLPLDFAEVEIGRRLYRDGNSDYLLNGSRVRLRDVQDLLLKAEVGQNSYTILGQGLVDEVLSMSPDERRLFLDEAADVKRFRMRIREAQDKLEATRENIERVTLIVDELGPRMEQLSRQADRAAEHARLSAELSNLLRVYFAHRWNAAQNRLVGSRARLDQANAEVNAANDRVVALREQVRALGDEIRRRRETIARLDSERAERQSRANEIEQAVALDRERHAMLVTRRTEVLAEADAIDAERAELAAADIGDGRREQEIADEAEAARTYVAECRADLETAEREYTAARARVDELRSAIETDRRRRGGVESDIQRASARIEQLGREAITASPRRTELLGELRAFGDRYLAHAQQVAEAEVELDGAREVARHARERLTRVSDEVRGFDEESALDLRELDFLEGRLEALMRVQAEHDGIAAGTRNALILGHALIQGVDPGGLGEPPEVPGILGVLATQLQVPAGLETAINAALEGRLHAVIVKSEKAALEAIARLRDRRQGRAQFLALDTFRHVYPLNLQKENKVIGVAARLVRCQRDVQPLVDTLLGRVIVCEDDETAMRMLRRGLGSCVTVDGTFFEGNGVVYGGATGSDEGPFRRQREIEELPAQIQALRERTNENARRMNEARAAVARLEAEAREAESIDTRVRRELDIGRASLERERAKLHRLRGEMGNLRLRLLEIDNERDRQQRAIEQAQAALDQVDKNTRLREASLQELVPELQRTTERREAALRATADAGARLAAVDGERRTLIAVKEQHDKAVERLSHQAAARREQAATLASDADAIHERIAAELLELETARARLVDDGNDSPDRHELQRLETHERQVQEVYAEAQTALLAADRMRLDLETETGRTEAEISALEEEMEHEGLQPDRRGNVVGFDESAAPSPIGGGSDIDVQGTHARITELRRQIRRLGPVNAEAPEDYRETRDRHEFLTSQLHDLSEAEIQLRSAIRELNGEVKHRFEAAFEKVDAAFSEYFAAFFGGGTAKLHLTDPSNPAESGVEIEAQPPGKKVQSLALLSGGERSLTAVALLFALLTINPAPFCVLDEVDAALDEANVGRFVNSVKRLAERTQFIMITHNRRTVEVADAIYGISMNADGVSRTLSLRLDEVPEN